jgi:hypothetical protein
MWGEWVDVSNIRADALAERRQGLRLTKAETARRMFSYIVETGPGARGGVALVGSGFAWATESACRRAIDDLEGGKRTFKEEQYVDALLTVLDLDVGPEQVGSAERWLVAEC